MKKRAQITFFVIFGIIILVLVLLTLHLKSTGEEAKGRAEVQGQLGFQSRVDSVKDHILSCAETVLAQAIVSKGLGETEISSYINENLALCTDFSMFKGMKITAGSVSSNVFKTSDEESINAEIDFPVTIEQGSSSARLNDFYVSYDVIAGTKLPIDINCVVTEDVTANSPDKDIELKISTGTKATMPDGSCVETVKVKLTDSTDKAISLFEYDLTPNSAAFEPYIKLEATYKDEDDNGWVDGTAVNERRIAVRYYDKSAGDWFLAPTDTDTIGNFLTARVYHFTNFRVGELLPFSARVYMADPLITPNLTIVQLKHLDGSGYLTGEYVEAKNGCKMASDGSEVPGECVAGPSLYSPDNIFVYEPIEYGMPGYFDGYSGGAEEANQSNITYDADQGNRFDETMAYYAADSAASFFTEKFGWQPSQKIQLRLYGPSDNWLGYTDGTSAIYVPRQNTGGPSYFRDFKGVFHEFTHIVHQSIYGRAPSVLAEGYAAYFPCSYVNDSRYSLYLNPSGGVDFESPSLTGEDSPGPFAAALWDVRKELGQEVTDKLVYTSWQFKMDYPPADAGMASLLEADLQLHNGTHHALIKEKFEKRGIICEDCTG